MNIVLVTHYFPGHGGGIEHVAEHIANRLVADFGHTLVWIASADADANIACVRGQQRVPVPALNWTERRLGIPYPVWGWRGLRKLHRFIEQCDVLHIHDCLYAGNVAATVLAMRHHKPVLVTQHIADVPYRSMVLRHAMKMGVRTISRAVMERADQVVFISRQVLAKFTNWVRFRAEPLYVPNGVDTEIFRPVSEEDRRRHRVELGWPVDRPVYLFVGRFVEKKGLEILHALAARRADALWVFAGRGPIAPESWGLPNVRRYSDRKDATLACLYQAADQLVLPSIGEGFPLVVQEAMACGTPVLTNSDTIRGDLELEGMINAAPVCPGEPQTTARAFEPLLFTGGTPTDVTTRNRLSGYARSRWSWETTANAYHQILERLLKRRA